MVQGKTKTTAHNQRLASKSEWIRVHNTHEPIVSREQFTQTQYRLEELSKNYSTLNKRPFTPNIYKGKVFCGHCGGSMHRQRRVCKTKDDVYFYLCLSNTRKARGSCISFQIPEDELTGKVLAALQIHADAIIRKAKKIRKNETKLDARRQAVNEKASLLRQEAEQHGCVFKSLFESLVSGLITSDEFVEMRESYETKVRNCLARALEIENRQAQLDKQITEYCELSDLLSDAKKAGMTALLVERVVDKIRIYSDRSIEVDFSFLSGFDLLGGVIDDG